MNIREISFPGQLEPFLTSEEILRAQEFVVSPSLPGNLYEITRFQDQSQRMFALKTLRNTVISQGKYPAHYSLEMEKEVTSGL